MTHVLELISTWAIPVVVAVVCFYAITKKVPVYSVFTEGAKEGFKTAVMIIPYLVAMLCAIGMFRASGAMDWLVSVINPVTSFYVVAVYFGAIGVTNVRQSIAAGLLGDLASLIAATVIVNAMWY